MVNSIKSHPPRSLCGLLKTGGGEAEEWDVGGKKKITEGVRRSFTTCLWAELLEKHVAPSEASTFRLWFCMHAAAHRYFTSFLLPKMTPIRQSLHKQTRGICIISHVLVSYRERDAGPPITDYKWAPSEGCYPLICFGTMSFFTIWFEHVVVELKTETEHYNHKPDTATTPTLRKLGWCVW